MSQQGWGMACVEMGMNICAYLSDKAMLTTSHVTSLPRILASPLGQSWLLADLTPSVADHQSQTHQWRSSWQTDTPAAQPGKPTSILTLLYWPLTMLSTGWYNAVITSCSKYHTSALRCNQPMNGGHIFFFPFTPLFVLSY